MRYLMREQVSIGVALLTVMIATLIGGGTGAFFVRDTVWSYTLAVAPGAHGKSELQYGAWPELANSSFFENVKHQFLADAVSFVEANLSTMQMRVYRKGELAVEVPIKSKGKEGSWWETPAGLYRAEGKSRNHFSSFGQVNMPYSIPFQGNFFIHGWPTYEDGSPVSSTYSGGCIRLADEHAKLVYDLVEVGMPILVFKEQKPETFSYMLRVPNISAQSYLVADLDTNFVLLIGDALEPRETSVAAKYMTAMVASEWQNIEKEARTSDVPDPLGLLAPNTRYSLYELFFPLLLQDSDHAARTLAAHFGTDRFLTLLEKKARAIGMTSSRFADPAGVLGYNTSTAEDLFHLLKYLRTNRPFVLNMSAGTVDTRTYGEPRFGVLAPKHPFAEDATFQGGAYSFNLEGVTRNTGSTAAVPLAFAEPTVRKRGHHDLVTVFQQPFEKGHRALAFIVLDSEDPVADTRALRSFVAQMYQ